MEMAWILRDRPFPTSTTQSGKTLDSPWFNNDKCPLFYADNHEIISVDTGRRGADRINTIFLAPGQAQEFNRMSIDLQVPLMHKESIKRHGMLRMDVISGYITMPRDKTGKSEATQTILGMHKIYRDRIRDFHCLNHLFLNGTIQLIARPDVRVGGRLRISRTSAPNSDFMNFFSETNETYYIESVSHQWTKPQGIRTSVAVTRGWTGTDSGLVRAIQEESEKFIVPEVKSTGAKSRKYLEAPTADIIPGAPNFRFSEFASKDGALMDDLVKVAVAKVARNLQALRTSTGRAVRINSGHRSQSHNASPGVHGSPTSRHLTGAAADFTVDGMTPTEIVAEMDKLISTRQMAEGGVGRYPSHVHYAPHGTRERWVGTYTDQG